MKNIIYLESFFQNGESELKVVDFINFREFENADNISGFRFLMYAQDESINVGHCYYVSGMYYFGIRYQMDGKSFIKCNNGQVVEPSQDDVTLDEYIYMLDHDPISIDFDLYPFEKVENKVKA